MEKPPREMAFERSIKMVREKLPEAKVVKFSCAQLRRGFFVTNETNMTMFSEVCMSPEEAWRSCLDRGMKEIR